MYHHGPTCEGTPLFYANILNHGAANPQDEVKPPLLWYRFAVPDASRVC